MSEIKSLAKGLKILDALLLANQDERTVTITTLAEQLGVNKSSASRLVHTLERHGFAEKAMGVRGYRLGKKLLQGGGYSPKDLRESATPFLQQLMQSTGECAHIAIYSHQQALIIADIEPTSSLKVSGEVGRLEPLYCTAVGKCLLAYLDVPLPAELSERMPNTITCVAALKQHLKDIRCQGYALDDEENHAGVRCLAAPVYDQYRQVIACLGISGPSVRMTQDTLADLARLVVESARELSDFLGSEVKT